MPNQHKRPPLALRLPEGLEAWYRAEAARRKMALNALAVEALQAFRDGPQKGGRSEGDSVAALLSPGGAVVTRQQAEALGLTVEARHLPEG